MEPLRIKATLTRNLKEKDKTAHIYTKMFIFGYRHLKHSSPRTASIRYTVRNRL